MTTRREFIIALGTAACALPREAFAQQQSGKVARVGWLSYLGAPDPGLALLREGMRELGYVEGKSYVILARYANGDFTQLPKLVDELAVERVDVIVSRGPSVDFTKAVRQRIPIVFAFSGDPIEAGFADSLHTPGRNMTGITFMAMELSAKRVEVLKEVIPKASRIALLSNPEHSGELSEFRVTEATARGLGLATTRFLVRKPEELTTAFAAIRADNPDAMIVFPDALTLARRKDIVDFSARARIPCIYGWTEFAESGGLMSYGPTLTENFKALAVFVDKLLKGADASRIPIEQVKKITLTLNLGAARSLGINIPQSVVARADMLIE